MHFKCCPFLNSAYIFGRFGSNEILPINIFKQYIFNISNGCPVHIPYPIREKKIGAQKYIIYLLGILSFMIGFFGEWGVVLLPFMLVVYFLRGKKKPRWFSYLGIELLAILFNSEYFYFIAFPFIAIYDGKRGPNTRFNKYFFYVFYIAHIWIIAFIDFWRRGAFL